MPPPTMGRAARGLYEGKHILFGNNVSFSKQHTRRTFKPNIQLKRVESVVLNEKFALKMSTHAMRCMKKAGGLDQYLLTSEHVKDSLPGRELKKRVELQMELMRLMDPLAPPPITFNVRLPRNRKLENAKAAAAAKAAPAKTTEEPASEAAAVATPEATA